MAAVNKSEKCSDEVFIALWEEHQSAAKLSRILNITERNIHLRRRSMEKIHGIKLNASNFRGALYDARKQSFSPLKQIDLGILDGTVIVFSDAHFIPGQRSTAFKGLLWAIQEFSPQVVICNGDAFDRGFNITP